MTKKKLGNISLISNPGIPTESTSSFPAGSFYINTDSGSFYIQNYSNFWLGKSSIVQGQISIYNAASPTTFSALDVWYNADTVFGNSVWTASAQINGLIVSGTRNSFLKVNPGCGGVYQITAGATYAVYRRLIQWIGIGVNGNPPTSGTYNYSQINSDAMPGWGNVSVMAYMTLSAGDTVQVWFKESGGTLVDNPHIYNCVLQVNRISKG